jgi:neurofibromin 1
MQLIDSVETVQSKAFVLDILHQSLRSSSSAPFPLDPDLARYLLSTVLADAPHDTPRTREVSNGSITRLTSSLSSHTLSKSSSRHSVQDSPRQKRAESTELATARRELHASVRHIVASITASNWSLVMNKIRTRIQHLCTTIEENPDLGDLRLIEWADLNRLRLGQLLQELSASFLHVKRHAQVPLAGAVRIAIWGWIDNHPDEFTQLIESNRRLEGGPDILFDHLHSASDVTSSSSVRRTRAFYPLMAMLLVLCPDILGRVAMGEMGRSSTIGKKASFVESLRKGFSTSKGFEAAASCYVDFISAASRLGSDGSGVRTLVADIQADLKVSLA